MSINNFYIQQVKKKGYIKRDQSTFNWFSNLSFNNLTDLNCLMTFFILVLLYTVSKVGMYGLLYILTYYFTLTFTQKSKFCYYLWFSSYCVLEEKSLYNKGMQIKPMSSIRIFIWLETKCHAFKRMPYFCRSNLEQKSS